MSTVADAAHPAHPRPSPDQATSVYRYYDARDVLIYVGMTRQGIGRNLQHNGKAEWWPFVARQEVEHLPTRAAALAREKALIQQLRPPFNKQHNIDHAVLRETYLRFVAQFHHNEGAFGLYKDRGKRLPCEIESVHGVRFTVRTTLDDALLASQLRFREALPPVYSWEKRGRHRIGCVQEIEYSGYMARLRCRTSRKDMLPEVIAHAQVRIKWQQLERPNFPYIKYVELVAEGVSLPWAE